MPRTAARSTPDTRTEGTRERLVEAAHEVLGAGGLAAFKVLDVASRAQANVALINYYFGGRDGLLDEVVRRVAEQIASQRAARLGAILAAAGDRRPDVRTVMHCWIDPWLENIERPDNQQVMLLMLHIMFAADVDRERKERLLQGSVEVTSRFIEVLCSCFPEVTREQMTWRMLCAVGASYLVLGQRHPVGWLVLAGKRRAAGRPDRQQAFDELVAFILAGLSTPGPASAGATRRAKAPKAVPP